MPYGLGYGLSAIAAGVPRAYAEGQMAGSQQRSLETRNKMEAIKLSSEENLARNQAYMQQALSIPLPSTAVNPADPPEKQEVDKWKFLSTEAQNKGNAFAAQQFADKAKDAYKIHEARTMQKAAVAVGFGQFGVAQKAIKESLGLDMTIGKNAEDPDSYDVTDNTTGKTVTMPSFQLQALAAGDIKSAATLSAGFAKSNMTNERLRAKSEEDVRQKELDRQVRELNIKSKIQSIGLKGGQATAFMKNIEYLEGKGMPTEQAMKVASSSFAAGERAGLGVTKSLVLERRKTFEKNAGGKTVEQIAANPESSRNKEALEILADQKKLEDQGESFVKKYELPKPASKATKEETRVYNGVTIVMGKPGKKKN